MHSLPDTRTAPDPEIMVDGLVGRKIGGEHPPLAPAPQTVEDGIDHLAHVGGARAATRFGRGNEWRQDGPFRIGEIRGVALRHPMPSTAGAKRANLTMQTTFQTGSQESFPIAMLRIG